MLVEQGLCQWWRYTTQTAPWREPAAGRTVDWEPLAAMPSGPPWYSCWGYSSSGFSQSVIEHGRDTRTQPFLFDAGRLSRLPLPGDSPSAWSSHSQNWRADWSSSYPSLLPFHSLFPVVRPASGSEGSPSLFFFLPPLSYTSISPWKKHYGIWFLEDPNQPRDQWKGTGREFINKTTVDTLAEEIYV